MISADKSRSGGFVTGVAFLGVGGTAALVGVILTAVGFGKGGFTRDPPAPTLQPGLITLGAGAGVLALGGVLLGTAPAQVQIQRGGSTLQLMPNGVRGSF